jgi:hypothetical protein
MLTAAQYVGGGVETGGGQSGDVPDLEYPSKHKMPAAYKTPVRLGHSHSKENKKRIK